MSRPGTVSLVLYRGRKAVRRFRPTHASVGYTYRLRISPKGLAAAAYKVRAGLARPGGSVRETLVSRRL